MRADGVVVGVGVGVQVTVGVRDGVWLGTTVGDGIVLVMDTSSRAAKGLLPVFESRKVNELVQADTNKSVSNNKSVDDFIIIFLEQGHFLLLIIPKLA